MLPLSLLRAAANSPMLVELKSGDTYNGRLVNCDAWMNLNLRDVICTSKDGDRFWKMPECYIRGSSVKYLRLPEEAIDQVPEDDEENIRVIEEEEIIMTEEEAEEEEVVAQEEEDVEEEEGVVEAVVEMVVEAVVEAVVEEVVVLVVGEIIVKVRSKQMRGEHGHHSNSNVPFIHSSKY
eukprot:CAMPEP_0197827018 /NCGR_PEP_ID=MMETSP1437-20131217/3900_1 /TAXON_ID=49252 ORGANISM="Eucampia antarctica, Strain CCMP1452" /NCGR_SAMPLE_ID=MMETSP1437 /ASSEMBLY_ACC=CAM_ASM_001096 /LENGTH=178 /DNA_ID=CAMNT_0043427717 /DNA_START=105 /DNA_END=642 /DNA_ORIENTATION=-